MATTETAYPVRLNERYPCQGRDANGEFITYPDLLEPGDVVGEEVAGDEMNCQPPFGVVCNLNGDLWILPAGDEYPDTDHPLRMLEVSRAVREGVVDGDQ